MADWDPQATATDGYVCPPCPVFRPTWDEFKHPLKYIASIRHIGMQAGICKIIPPEGWQPPFAINEKTFRFRTRVQQLNCIDGHTRAEGQFVEALRMFLYRNGTPMQELPRIDGQLLNLYLLYKTVVELGGFDTVCSAKQWGQVVRRVGRTRASDRPTAALCQQYQKYYEECLLVYEQSKQTSNAKSILQTPDIKKEAPHRALRNRRKEDEEVPTPSPKTRSSMKKRRQDVRMKCDDSTDSDGSTSPDSKRVKRTLFSDGDLTSSEDSDFLADTRDVKVRPLKNGRRKNGSAMKSGNRLGSSQKANESLTPEGLRPDPTRNVRLEPPELLVGQQFYHYFPDRGAIIGEVLRVVRGKKPHVFVKYAAEGKRDTIDLSTLQMIVANGWDPESAELATKNEICQSCLRGDCWDRLLLCDGCNSGHHLFCLSRPLSRVPTGDWYCDSCVSESVAPTKDKNPKFGFEMGSEYTLATYKEKADTWKRTYFGFSSDEEAESLSDRDLEREYWRILSTPVHEQRLEVEYGSDVDSGAVGSGFPRADDHMKTLKALERRLRILSGKKGATESEKKMSRLFSRGLEAVINGGDSVEAQLKKYASDDWNLNNLPKLKGSVLQHLDEDIKGVMVPWIYMGMCFSTFCWHVEDHNFYSISYNHCGAPKTWYGVPCDKAEYFESVMKKLTPELFGSQPDLHLQLVTMFSPETLIQNGVPVYRATHKPNEFMVTFPSAYHGGFNNGFNCAEAVNFSTVDWLPWGARSVLNYRKYCKLPVFCHEALVVTLAETLVESSSFDYHASQQFLLPAIEQLVQEVAAFEKSLQKRAVTRRESMAEYAKRHGLPDSSLNPEAETGAHPRACRRAKMLPLADNAPVSDDGNNMKRSSKMTVVAPSSQQGATRPTRMVLWAGNSGKNEGLRCSTCKQYCFLQAVACTRCRHQSSVGCVEHYISMCKCDLKEHSLYLYRYDKGHLDSLLKHVRGRLEVVRSWQARRLSLFGNSGAQKPSIDEVRSLLVDGRICGGADEDHLFELELAVDCAVKWNERATLVLNQSRIGAIKPSDARQELLVLSSTAEQMLIRPDCYTQVDEVLVEANSRITQARSLLKSVDKLRISESSQEPIRLNQEQDIKTLSEQNRSHRERVVIIPRMIEMAELSGLPLPQEILDRLRDAQNFLAVVTATNEMLIAIAAYLRGLAEEERGRPPADLRVVMESDCRELLHQATHIENACGVKMTKLDLLRSLLWSTESHAVELRASLDDRSKSMEELDAIWKRLRCLPVCPDHLNELGDRLRRCREWEIQAQVFLRSTLTACRNQVVRTLPQRSLMELEAFVVQADSHFVPSSSIVRRQMHTRLQDCRRWYTAVQALFFRSNHTDTTLSAFVEAAFRRFHSPFPAQLMCICDQVLNDRASIISCNQCTRLYHAHCVGLAPTMLSSAHRTFVCNDCVQPPLRKSYPPPIYPGFCSCRGPEDMSMICCDVCDEWYHSGCVGMAPEEMNRLEAYRCQRCVIKQHLYYLDKKLLRKVAVGRRPAIARVEAMLNQLDTSLVAVPPGAPELLEYLALVRQVEERVRSFIESFVANVSVANITSLNFHEEERLVLELMHQLTSLEVSLDGSINILAAIHWCLRVCRLVLRCKQVPKYSNLVILLNDSKQSNFVFPAPEYARIQQTVEDRVQKAKSWLTQVKLLEGEQWNTELAQHLRFQLHELQQFLELPTAEVDFVLRIASTPTDFRMARSGRQVHHHRVY